MLSGVALCVALSGCGWFGDDEEILPGERIPVRAEVAETPMASPPPLMLPPAVPVSSWTQRNSTATHVQPHAALGSALRLAWSADAGSGNGSTLLTSGPVAANGRVYTLDSSSEVTAFTSGGERVWRVDVSPEGEDGENGYGGGLALGEGGRLFVTTGFGQVVALDAASGEEYWRTPVRGIIRSAPTVANGRVFIVTRDDQAVALNAESGQILWRLQGAAGVTGIMGGASPAVDDVLAVLPFSSGEVTGALAASGRRIWTAAIAGGRRGYARADIGDITGDPVILGDTIFVANQSGRLVSIDRRTGQRNWTANHGSINAVQPAGNSLFVLSDTAKLLRLDAPSGALVWSTDLPEYDDPEDRDIAIGYGGPVLAGGRLVVVSADGLLLSFDPATGEELSRLEMPEGAYLPPAVADGKLYVMSVDGDLLAFQ
ncbi:PQQ-binding-like beta-propeller repeat protein [Oceanicella sp. SM1341]|uniref:outer membrane protein assembly factor BamB family protein n=1 Tax=Oceanicella sp. SM1341 TaxID=1548889 RepID=UPI0013004595|nr:PQQ-binding-like beta-propeller repeat protein [Oceanicella sp. SM1341]